MVGYVIGKDGSRGEAQEAHLDEDPPFVANSLTYVLVFNFQLASGPRQTTQDALKDRVQSCVGDVRARIGRWPAPDARLQSLRVIDAGSNVCGRRGHGQPEVDAAPHQVQGHTAPGSEQPV